MVMDIWTISLRILLFPSALVLCSDSFHSECYTVNGADYRGTQNQTSLDGGKPCLFWNETFQHPYNTLKYPNGEGGLGEHNYCRNPDGDVSPWCYIPEQEDGVYWKYCDIPTCKMPGNLGCFRDHGNPPPLTGISETSNKQTIQTCITMCRRQRYKLAGLEAGFACFCGNNADYRKHGEMPSTDCNSVCFGDHTQPCGGDGRIILFDSLIGACGGNYTMNSAVIYSPDFPDSYGTGKACYWTIQVTGASLIRFNFTFFDIKDSRDMVELLDGYTKQVLIRFDGRNHPTHSFNISLDFVILYFFSDRINQAQGFSVVYEAFKEESLEKPNASSNQTQTELITQTTNLSINAARSSKILYVITTSPSRPSGHVPGWTVYALTGLLILTIIAVLAKALLHISMKSARLASPSSLDSCHRGSAGEIWSIFYKPSTSISIFPKKLKGQHDDRNPLVGE